MTITMWNFITKVGLITGGGECKNATLAFHPQINLSTYRLYFSYPRSPTPRTRKYASTINNSERINRVEHFKGQRKRNPGHGISTKEDHKSSI
jgi:hypothetical protein